MGIGAVIKLDGVEIFTHSQYIPKAWANSNNVAEYLAFESILDFLKESFFTNRKIHICGDSQLVINQMLGKWNMNGGRYMTYALRCKDKLQFLRSEFKLSFTLQWIPRGQNHYADELSKAQLIKNKVEFRIQPLNQ